MERVEPQAKAKKPYPTVAWKQDSTVARLSLETPL